MRTVFGIFFLSLFLTISVSAQKKGFFEKRKVACQGKSVGKECLLSTKKGQWKGTCQASGKNPSLLVCRRGEKKRFKRLVKELDLTEEQVKKLWKKRRKRRKVKGREVVESLKVLRKKMKESFLNNASNKELQNLHKKIKKTRNKLMDMRFKRMMDLKGILNKEQRKKFIELKKNRQRSKK